MLDISYVLYAKILVADNQKYANSSQSIGHCCQVSSAFSEDDSEFVMTRDDGNEFGGILKIVLGVSH